MVEGTLLANKLLSPLRDEQSILTVGIKGLISETLIITTRPHYDTEIGRISADVPCRQGEFWGFSLFGQGVLLIGDDDGEGAVCA